MTETTLAEWLERQLRRREWSRSDLARHLGVGTGTVSKWFNGRQPSPEYIDRIADVLGADRDLVLSLAGHRALDEELDPESPAGRIHALVDRMEWTDEKVIAIEGLLQMYLEADRKKRVRR